MKSKGLIFYLFLAISTFASGQYTKEFKRIFFDADYLYFTGFYEEALNRYKNLLRLDPGNDNINFRCGACCLSIQGMEKEAIPYLEEAVDNVSHSYDPNSEKETSAPVLTYFMLANAYHLENKVDKAIIYYKKYIESGADEDPMQMEYAALQLEACSRAELLAGKPPDFLFASVLDQFDADLPSCSNPVVSGDGNILIFLVDFPSDKKIMMTVRNGDYWSEPREINSEIGMVGETYPTSISYDGKDLYLVHEYYSHSDIFISRYVDGRWSEAEALNHNINKRTSENHASISKDGNKLYFTSDRRGGRGSYDIYVSEMVPGKGWGPAVNIGPEINTPYEENTPFISANDSILFFSSQGHSTVGGHDIFFSELDRNGRWKEPENLGYPVSTTADNFFFNPGWDELEGYYSVRKASDPGSSTINMVIELEPEMQALLVETNQISTMPAGFPQENYPPIKVLSGVLTFPGMTGKVEGGKVEPESVDASYIREVIIEKGDTMGPELSALVEQFAIPEDEARSRGPVLTEGANQTGPSVVMTEPRKVVDTSGGIEASKAVEPLISSGSVITITTVSDLPEDESTQNNQIREWNEALTMANQNNAGNVDQATEKIAEDPGLPAIKGEYRVSETAREVDLGPVALTTGIPFNYNDYNLNLPARLEVEKLLELMKRYPDIHIELTGRADANGSADYNMRLSYQRAEEVEKFLITGGIHSDRITSIGKGELDPIALNRNPDGSDAPLGRYLNRQVSVTVYGLEQIPLDLIGLYIPVKLRPDEKMKNENSGISGKRYTIQVLANKEPAEEAFFEGLDPVYEFRCKDGFHRYSTGVFDSLSEAQKRLTELRRNGHPNAFIQTMDWYTAYSR